MHPTLFLKNTTNTESSVSDLEFTNKDCVIFNLVGDRKVDVIGGNPACQHSNVVSEKCQECGASVVVIGYETDILDFYAHSHYIVNKNKHNNAVVLLTKSLIPIEYRVKVFGRVHTPFLYRHLMYSKKDKAWINIFSKNRMSKNFEVVDSFMEFNIRYMLNLNKVVFVNPKKEDFGFGFNYVIINKDRRKDNGC